MGPDSYQGPRTGYRLVHTRIISEPVWTRVKQDDSLFRALIEREMDAAEAAVKLMVPGAIKRVGCNRTCCYGPGPDIEIYMPSDQPDGSAVIEAFVDFDFEPPQD